MTDKQNSPDDERKDDEKPRGKLILVILLLLLLLITIGAIIVANMRRAPSDSASPPTAAAEPATPSAEDELAKLTLGKLDDDNSIIEFIRRFIESGEDDGPEAELSFYADAVESYFEKPNLDKAKILTDRENYAGKWPDRSYNCVGDPEIVERLDGGVVLAKATFEYVVKNADKEAKGTGVAFYKIRQRGDHLEIFWIGEKLE